ncbi:hypothetical protein SCLCIDRAFT_1217494 [Scleroderma citrinum Foug A]|uniref:Uncharacterized protein n=1 Tax=Scleroderma citrinum Foug A TaxID=1036808 RepID=A0A0C3DUV1_9AGAM|nr:hypothetical protein SCLCIDRAFT_1217494 [Scleroderma citrinum Foug A]
MTVSADSATIHIHVLDYNRADLCHWNDSRQDLTYCYVHMTEHELRAIDTVDTIEYISAELSDDGKRSIVTAPSLLPPTSFLCQPSTGP